MTLSLALVTSARDKAGIAGLKKVVEAPANGGSVLLLTMPCDATSDQQFWQTPQQKFA